MNSLADDEHGLQQMEQLQQEMDTVTALLRRLRAKRANDEVFVDLSLCCFMISYCEHR